MYKNIAPPGLAPTPHCKLSSQCASPSVYIYIMPLHCLYKYTLYTISVHLITVTILCLTCYFHVEIKGNVYNNVTPYGLEMLQTH